MLEKREIGLYIHIPFCMHKCNYCDFLSGESVESTRYLYVNALVRELKHTYDKFGVNPSDCIVSTVYIGGGTPSILDDVLISRIIDGIKETFHDFAEDAEITIEINPGTVNRSKLQLYRRLGINRLSIGLQSANADELRLLGRIHSYEEFENCYKLAQKTGFYNINVDIMTALPGQTMDKLSATLDKVLMLAPEHISAYSLIIEEGTPLHVIYGGGQNMPGYPSLPTEDEERQLYYYTTERLSDAGYIQYEISNYSKPGYESRHNSAYWKRKEYLGYGLGAAGLVNNVRLKNTSDISAYIAAPYSKKLFEENRTLSENDQIEEFMFLGLRMRKGVSVYEFERIFNKNIHMVYGKKIDKLVNEELIIENFGSIYLSKKGIDYGNYVFSEFLLD